MRPPTDWLHPRKHTGVKSLDVVTSAIWSRYACAGKIKRLNPVEKKSSPCRYIAVSLRRCRPVQWVFCAVPDLVCMLLESFFFDDPVLSL